MSLFFFLDASILAPTCEKNLKIILQSSYLIGKESRFQAPFHGNFIHILIARPR